jgi:hypothetical protein
LLTLLLQPRFGICEVGNECQLQDSFLEIQPKDFRLRHPHEIRDVCFDAERFEMLQSFSLSLPEFSTDRFDLLVSRFVLPTDLESFLKEVWSG